MVLVSGLPGTQPISSSTPDGYTTIASIKDNAKHSVSLLRGAAPISMLNSAKSQAEQGIILQDAGDLQGALLKYYIAANLSSNALNTSEYKQEAAAGRHGAVYQQAKQFLEFFDQMLKPRLQAVEFKLQEVEQSRPSPTTTSSPKKPARQLSGDSDGPNESAGGSIQDRLRKLKEAGLETSAAGVPSKRFSHRSNPSSSSSTAFSPTFVSRSPRVGHLFEEESSGVDSSSSPKLPTRSPSLPPSAFDGLSPSIAGPSKSRSPSSSPRLRSSEIRRQGTGGSAGGVTSSPGHRNIQSLADLSPSETSTSHQPPSPLGLFPSNGSMLTPSISTFSSSFPTIEDLDAQFGQTSITSLPSAPTTDLKSPTFPSPPTINPGTRPPRAGPPPSSANDLNLRKDVPSSPDLSNFPSQRSSTSANGLPKQHTGSSHSGAIRPNGTGTGNASTYTRPQYTSPTPGSPTLVSSAQWKSFASTPTPTTTTPTQIDATTLYSWLEMERRGNGAPILLLDVRSREAFESERIEASNIACIEPTILLRSNLDASALESALVVSPDAEEKAFASRAGFKFVVMYDEIGTSKEVMALFRVLTEEVGGRKIQLPPMLLVGGLAKWKKELGEKGLFGRSVPLKPKQEQARHGVQQPKTNGMFNVGTTKGDPSPERMDGMDKADRRRAHVRDGAVFEPIRPNGVHEGVPQSPTDEFGVRKSTLVRPSSSGTISAYNRPLIDSRAGDLYAAHTPITYPSRIISPTSGAPPSSFTAPSSSYLTQPPAVAAPPVASMGVSPLARRRSDYVEQSLYSYSGIPPGTTRASIDYPSLSVQNFVQPPPPAVSSAMVRRDSRPRGHASSYSSPNAPVKGMTYIAGLAIETPKTIPPNYTVVYWSDTQIGMSGLRNLGNTCYMNSIIQCLSATVPFARFFIDGRWRSSVNLENPLGTRGAVADAFAKILHDLWQGDSTYITPYSFRKSIVTYASNFGGSDQHDAQEFLSFLLDGLHEDLNRVQKKPLIPAPTAAREKELETLPQQIAGAEEWQLYRFRDDSVVVDYFQGQFRNRLTCLSCESTSTTFNSFMYLSLPIPTGRGVTKVSLSQCLDAFVKPEVMEKADAWKCPHCKQLRKATKQLSLSRLPPVLLIHLKRFSFKGPFTDKLETMVDFPVKNLDLTNYMPSLLPPNIDQRGTSQQGYGPDDPRTQVPPYRYELYGVTNHFGSLSSGHYTSFIASKGGWVYCDDSRLTNADPRDVVGRPAYILFYRRVDVRNSQ